MLAYKEMKVEFDVLCGVCLSPGRTLRELGSYETLFAKLVGDSVEDSKSIQLCWECLAVLRRVSTFNNNVKKAQIILQNCTEDKPKSLSKLGVCQPNLTILINNNKDPNETNKTCNIELKPDETIFKEVSIRKIIVNSDTKYEKVQKDHRKEIDIKDSSKEYPNGGIQVKQEDIEAKDDKIKIEIDCDDCNDNDDDVFENIDYGVEVDDIEEIKQEVPKKRAKNIPAPKKYKYRRVELTMAKNTTARKINHTELMEWLEERRKCTDFSKTKWRCETCVEWFKNKEYFDKHVKEEHKAREYTCTICQSTTDTEEALSSHTEDHYTMVTCRVCDYKSDLRGMPSHLEKHPWLFKCVLCPGTFDGKRNFYKHYNTLHTLFICNECGIKKPAKCRLIKHIKTKHTKATCPHCGQVFKKQYTLKYHVDRLHTYAPSEESYCVLCDKQFPNIAAFTHHVKTHVAHAFERAPREKQKYKCPGCNNEYSRKQYMKNHYKVVHLKDPYACDLCDMAFLRKSKLNIHIKRRHEGIPPQKNKVCNICGRAFETFIDRTKLRSHVRRRHEGKQPPKNKVCNICGRAFETNGILKKHIRTHTGERPYKCDRCDAKFTQKCALTSHMKFIHLKLKRNADRLLS